MDDESLEKLHKNAKKHKDISKIAITEEDQVEFKFLDDELKVLETV